LEIVQEEIVNLYSRWEKLEALRNGD